MNHLMNLIKLSAIIIILTIIYSCPQPDVFTYFSIQNLVDKAVILNLSWGNYTVGSSIYPGAKSNSVMIDNDDAGKNKIFFYMKAKNNSIYLETVDDFPLSEGEDKVFIIDGDTKVRNPITVRSVKPVLTIKELLNQ